MPIPKTRTKLLNLFKKIQDENVRVIISKIVDLEDENRSSNRFPNKKVEDIVDNEANLIELKVEKK